MRIRVQLSLFIGLVVASSQFTQIATANPRPPMPTRLPVLKYVVQQDDIVIPEPVVADINEVTENASAPIKLEVDPIASSEYIQQLDEQIQSLQADIAEIKENAAAAKLKAACRPSVNVHGRVYFDWAFFDQDAASIAQVGRELNAFEPREMRLELDGKSFDVFEWKFKFDIARNDAGTSAGGKGLNVVLKDTYVGMKDLPLVGHVRFGYYKAPFSLEQLTSSKYNPFMERSLGSAFTTGRMLGVMIYDTIGHDERGTWALAGMTRVDSNSLRYENDRQGTGIFGRLTCLPYYHDTPCDYGLVHLGISAGWEPFNGEDLEITQRPENHVAEDIMEVLIEDASHFNRIVYEFAWVAGPFSIQSEYYQGFAKPAFRDYADFNGGYIFASYFLTGEHRVYKKSGGKFDMVRPHENVFCVRDCNGCVRKGCGAWELAYRFSWLDGNDLPIYSGGNTTDHTFGVNWYLTPYMRVMFNYINADTRWKGLDANQNIFAARFQYFW